MSHFRCFGKKDIEASKTMESDTISRIASMTKPIVSVAVMMLYEEARFQLEDPVSKFIPEFKNMQILVNMSGGSSHKLIRPKKEITIRDLLTHTSGLVRGNANGSPAEIMIWQANQEAKKHNPDETLGEWTQRLVNLPLAHQPGSKWYYGPSTNVLGHLVEVISGNKLNAFLKQRIFEPLGM